jgi:hypothetical protein
MLLLPDGERHQEIGRQIAETMVIVERKGPGFGLFRILETSSGSKTRKQVKQNRNGMCPYITIDGL